MSINHQVVIRISDNRVLRHGYVDFTGQLNPGESILTKEFNFNPDIDRVAWFYNLGGDTFDIGASIVKRLDLNELSVIDPTVTDDISKGYHPGSFWVNNFLQEQWVCVSSALNDAQWIKFTDNTVNAHTKIVAKAVKGSQLILATDGNYYLKMDIPMFANSSFVKVYLNGILLTYAVNWAFGSRKVGLIDDLLDNIRIITPYLPTDDFVLIYTENIVHFFPTLKLYRVDGVRAGNHIITPRLHDTSEPLSVNRPKVIWSLIPIVGQEFTYNAEYRRFDGTLPRNVVKVFSTHLRIAEYPVMQDLGDWRIEIYKIGAKNSSGNSSGSNNNLTPFITSYDPIDGNYNQIGLFNHPALDNTYGRVHGIFKVRLRNMVTNAITEWADKDLFIRNHYVWQHGNNGDTYIGKYRVVRLK